MGQKGQKTFSKKIPKNTFTVQALSSDTSATIFALITFRWGVLSAIFPLHFAGRQGQEGRQRMLNKNDECFCNCYTNGMASLRMQ